MTLEFLSDAATEFYAAADLYEFREKGLGTRFRSEVLEVCALIVQQPLLWRERSGGYRRVNCPVFPYYVAYFIRGDRILQLFRSGPEARITLSVAPKLHGRA